MRLSFRPRWRILGVVVCLAACASPAGSPATNPSAATSTAAASVGTTTGVPTSDPSVGQSEEPTIAPSDAPAPSSDPSSPAPSLDDRVRVVTVETVDERTRDLMIETPSLPNLVGVRLLLPAGFETEPDRQWPVLYLLHGAGGGDDSYLSWVYGTDVQALVAPTNLLVVMPQGDGFGWYSDWWNGGNGGPPMWETFHLTELMAILERDWRAGDQRAIAGLSMGGYGAMVYAARHPGMFKAAASFSGPLDILGEKDSGLLGNDVATWGDPVEQVDVWRAHNPIDLADALRGTTLYVSYGEGGQGPLDPDPVGDDGEAFRAIGNRAFVDRLEELGIPATVDAYGPGTHTWPYFERALHESLPLLLEAVGEVG
jgi:S-formylglutathione hydrolase FrmB